MFALFIENVTLNTKTQTVTVIVVTLTLFGITILLGLSVAISAVYFKKRKSIIEIQTLHNVDLIR